MSRSMLESVGSKDIERGDVLSLELRSSSKPEVTLKIFGTMDDRMRLSGRALNFSLDDRLELVTARKVELQNFADDFNKHLPLDAQNARLSFEKQPMLKVDDVQFPLKEHRLETHRLDAVLRALLERRGDVAGRRSRREREVGRSGGACQINASRGIHGDAASRVVALAAQICGV